MISTINPQTMTSDERRAEVATILARGLLRRIPHARQTQQESDKRVSEDSQIGLDVPAKIRLSVSQRPTG